MLKRILFFWLTSSGLATAGYYLLWLVLPGRHVFGAPYRMLLYHEAHPLGYIALCGGCYGLLAAPLVRSFWQRGTRGRIGLMILISGLALAMSAPLGGMLWYWHDMQAGFFPPHWGRVLVVAGARDGLTTGWLVLLLSIPYNLLGLFASYFLLQTGGRLFYAAPK